MMRAILVVLCLLLSAATASAECAWVMWNDSPSWFQTRENRWRAVRGFTSLTECQQFVDTMLKMPPGVVPSIEKGDEYSPPYTCLPDTVDPRVPKASGR